MKKAFLNSIRFPSAGTLRPAACIALLFASCCLFLAIGSSAQESASDLEASKADLARLRDEVSKITAQIEDQRARQSRLEKDIQRHDKELAKTGSEKFGLLQQAEALEERKKELNKRESTLEVQIEQQRESISAQVVAAYHLREHNQIKQWLAQKNPAQARRDIQALGLISEQTDKQLKAFEANLIVLQAVKVDIEENSRRITSNLRQTREKEALLAKQREKRVALLTRLESDLARNENQVKAQVDQEAELESLIESLERNAQIEAESQRVAAKEFAARKSSKFSGKFSQAKSKLYWPAEGKHTSRFGSIKPGSDARSQGVTIAADAGSPVYAVFSGVVIFADYLPAQGMLIIVDHGDDYWSLYSHNESLLHAVGDYVEESQPIATVGASGGLKNTGLYFEIRQKGKPTNPAQWCQRA